MARKLLCVGFDGVLHANTTPYVDAATIPGPATPGAMAFLVGAVERFDVAIFSHRSSQKGGAAAMTTWLLTHLFEYLAGKAGDNPHQLALDVLRKIKWPPEKPDAFLFIDDRAITFAGHWPGFDELAAFKPWNKTGEHDGTNERRSPGNTPGAAGEGAERGNEPRTVVPITNAKRPRKTD